ncbi:MAG: RNA polymerase sigma factor [Bacteroidetes bacterium]|nr:RNA polymerase sigma factor [Bacteroidota bacterium]
MDHPIQDIHRKLVEKCQSGDRKAQYELYNAYARAMYNLCFRMLNQAEEASDLLQDSFIDAFTRIHSFRFESTFGAWLKRIVINKCINAIQKRKLELVDREIPETYPDSSNEDGIDEEMLQLSVDRVKKAMMQLPDNARLVFSLYLFEGYDHTEIADILHITESTSKTQFMRAKQRVKEILLAMPDYTH